MSFFATGLKLFVAFVAVFCGLGVHIWRDSGENETLLVHGSDMCTSPITGAGAGCEDLHLINGEWILASCADHRLLSKGKSDFGGLFRLTSSGTLQKLELVGYTLDKFHPHGIYALDEPEDGWTRVFVVNHAVLPGKEIISVFLTDGKVAKFVEHIEHPLLVHPNDVTAVSKDEVWVTRSNYYPFNTLANFFEIATKQKWTYVAKCTRSGNGAWECTKAIPGLQTPNGIIFNQDKTELYVVDTGSRLFHTYSRNKGGDIKPVSAISVGLGCDNLAVNYTSGEVWSACHPKLLTFVGHAQDESGVKRAPTRVISIQPKTGKITEHLLTEGEEFSAASVAFPSHNSPKFWLGAVFDDGVQECQL
eukprot:TRINITY_DN114746_c0_g1_i1.p1 TRINITY_DN114746_c0_g1~~TRINITY_DN114746_c0_g1_i1.p1  ORF type:complete len:362 (+),score=18.33 TRINITY_DN114746_c0_g1_i1:21-1106(+)